MPSSILHPRLGLIPGLRSSFGFLYIKNLEPREPDQKTRTRQLLGVDIHGLYGYCMSTPMVTYWCGGKNPLYCSQRGERQNCRMGLI